MVFHAPPLTPGCLVKVIVLIAPLGHRGFLTLNDALDLWILANMLK